MFFEDTHVVSVFLFPPLHEFLIFIVRVFQKLETGDVDFSRYVELNFSAGHSLQAFNTYISYHKLSDYEKFYNRPNCLTKSAMT